MKKSSSKEDCKNCQYSGNYVSPALLTILPGGKESFFDAHQIPDPISQVSLRLSLYFCSPTAKILLSNATGFAYKAANECTYLVTNWHVLSGLHTKTKQPMHKCSSLPNMLGIHIPAVVPTNSPMHKMRLWYEHYQPLISEDGNCTWYEYSKFKKKYVDIALIKLPKRNLNVTKLTRKYIRSNIRHYPSQQVSIVGYPENLTGGQLFPIWKTGHIASEPSMENDRKPRFLVDAVTNKGMSGSPVVYRSDRYQQEMKDGSMATIQLPKPLSSLLGVYSSRQSSESSDPLHLGHVWQARLVEEIAVGEKLATINNNRVDSPPAIKTEGL